MKFRKSNKIDGRKKTDILRRIPVNPKTRNFLHAGRREE